MKLQNKARFCKLKDYITYSNCLAARNLAKQSMGNSPPKRLLIRPLLAQQLKPKWGVVTLIHHSLAPLITDLTPRHKWAKGRVCASLLRNNKDCINLVNVYAPAGDAHQKQNFFEQLHQWLCTLHGEILLGGDWNMTISKEDQLRSTFNYNKNAPLIEMDKALRLKDLYIAFNKNSPPQFTWKQKRRAEETPGLFPK